MTPEEQFPEQQAQGSEQEAQGAGIAQASGGGQAIVNIYQVPGSAEDISRQRLLAKVHAFWISGFLEKSLHGAALIELHFEHQTAAVENPWRLVVQETGQPDQMLPATTPSCRCTIMRGERCLFWGRRALGRPRYCCNWPVI